MAIAVCLVVKNEEDSLAEWMAYHLAIGFDTIIVFDNVSTDRTADVIELFARHHDVRRINWANTTHDYQLDAYNFAVTHLGNQFEWMAFIDCDEFLVPLRDETIGITLSRLPDAAAVGAHWAMFGSSGHVQRPDGLVIEAFRRRSEPGFWANQHIKSILRPGRAGRAVNAHYFEVEEGYVTPEAIPIQWSDERGIAREPPVYHLLQVNHYFVKSKEQWARKMARGYHDVKRLDPDAEFNHNDRNEVEDTAILRFLAKTRAILAATR